MSTDISAPLAPLSVYNQTSWISLSSRTWELPGRNGLISKGTWKSAGLVLGPGNFSILLHRAAHLRTLSEKVFVDTRSQASLKHSWKHVLWKKINRHHFKNILLQNKIHSIFHELFEEPLTDVTSLLFHLESFIQVQFIFCWH